MKTADHESVTDDRSGATLSWTMSSVGWSYKMAQYGGEIDGGDASLSHRLQETGYSLQEAEQLAQLAEGQMRELQARAEKSQRSARRVQYVFSIMTLAVGLGAAVFSFLIAGRVEQDGFSSTPLIVAGTVSLLLAISSLYIHKKEKNSVDILLKSEMEHTRRLIEVADFAIAVRSVSDNLPSAQTAHEANPREEEGPHDGRADGGAIRD